MAKAKSQVSFPYATLDAAIQDKYAKIGGPLEAFRILSNGFKQEFWRKKAGEKHKDEVKLALKLYREGQLKAGGDKADRQLRDAAGK